MNIATRPLVYVVVLNYCALQDTLQCIDALDRLSYENLRVVVVDNNSPDRSGDAIRAAVPADRFIQLPVNQGYAEGNNVVIRMALDAGADYVFVLNPDVRVPRDAIERYIQVMQSDASIGALNPIQLSPDSVTVDARFRWTVWGKGAMPDSTLLKPRQVWDTQTLLGAALLISSAAIREVGLFDPLYFAYGEEQDLSRRFRYHNFRLVVTSDAPVIHLRTHENRGTDDWRLFLRLKGVYLYELKDPYRPFTKSLGLALRRLLRDITSRRSPYAHVFTMRHYLRVAFWIARNIREIHRHIALDKAGSAYL